LVRGAAADCVYCGIERDRSWIKRQSDCRWMAKGTFLCFPIVTLMTEVCKVVCLVCPNVVILFSSVGEIDFRKRRQTGSTAKPDCLVMVARPARSNARLVMGNNVVAKGVGIINAGMNVGASTTLDIAPLAQAGSPCVGWALSVPASRTSSNLMKTECLRPCNCQTTYAAGNGLTALGLDSSSRWISAANFMTSDQNSTLPVQANNPSFGG
jgi:hypothetical protein